MRTLASDTLAVIADGTGIEPLVIIQIDWTSGTKYYSEKDLTFLTTDDTLGKIISTGSITSQQRDTTTGDLSTMQVQLDDTDGEIKSNVDVDQIIGTAAHVWYAFDNGDGTHTTPVLLMKGHIASDVVWDEGARQITLTIDTAANNRSSVIGYAPTTDDFPNLNTEVSGKMWPICFGSVVKVPTVQVYKAKRGTLSTYLTSSNTTINVENGDAFPQGTSIQIQAGFVVCTGSFTGTLFTLTSINDPYYTGITVAARGGGVDGSDPSILWITDGTKNMVGQYCYIPAFFGSGGPLVNYCNRQEGTKLFFLKPWKANGNHPTWLLTTGTTIAETSLVPRTSWGDTFKLEHQTGSIWTADWTVIPDSETEYPGFGVIEFGIPSPTYVCNSVSTTSVKGVYAYRTIDGIKQLVQIPSSRYVKNLNTTLNGQLCTTIVLYTELTDYQGENWDTAIYVTLVSAEGPNTADVIQYLLETYTPFTADPTTFASTNTLLTHYPSHFALFDQKDIISLVADIAYQARCYVTYDGDTCKIGYLSKIPTVYADTDASNIGIKTIGLGYTNRDDIITDFTLTWRTDYISEEKEYRYKNNIDLFGQNKDTHDFFIYNIESLVALSAAFWGVRRSNCWRTNKYRTFLNGLAYETFDCVRFKVDVLDGATYLKSMLTGITFDTTDSLIDLDATLAVKSGTLTEDDTFYTGFPAITGSEPTPGDPTNGVAEVDYLIYVIAPNNPAVVNATAYNIRFTTTPASFVRGVAQTVEAQIVDVAGNPVPITTTLTLSLAEITAGDTLSVGTISFVNGVGSVNVSMTGGSTNTTGVLNISGTGYGVGISSNFTITSHATPTIVITPTVTNRGDNFSVAVTGGDASTVYTVSIFFADGAEVLENTSGPVTSFTTNGSGAFSAADWKFTTGTLSLDSGFIRITAGSITHDSDTLTILDVGAATGTALSETVHQIAHPFTFLTQVAYLSAGVYDLATTNSTAIETNVVGVITAIPDADHFEITYSGRKTVAASGRTPNVQYFASSSAITTPGTPVAIAPRDIADPTIDKIIKVFRNISATDIIVEISVEPAAISAHVATTIWQDVTVSNVPMVPGILYTFDVCGSGGGGSASRNLFNMGSVLGSVWMSGCGASSGGVVRESILATEGMTYSVTTIGFGGAGGLNRGNNGSNGVATTLVIKRNGTTIRTIVGNAGIGAGDDPGTALQCTLDVGITYWQAGQYGRLQADSSLSGGSLTSRAQGGKSGLRMWNGVQTIGYGDGGDGGDGNGGGGNPFQGFQGLRGVVRVRT